MIINWRDGIEKRCATVTWNGKRVRRVLICQPGKNGWLETYATLPGGKVATNRRIK
jgi:hypothetical protein